MTVSTTFHIDREVSQMDVHLLPDSRANVMQIVDKDFNQVAVFMSLDQMLELSNKLKEYVESQGGNN